MLYHDDHNKGFYCNLAKSYEQRFIPKPINRAVVAVPTKSGNPHLLLFAAASPAVVDNHVPIWDSVMAAKIGRKVVTKTTCTR